MKLIKIFFSSIFALVLLLSTSFADEGRLLRYPDIYQDKIVFVYGGDLWIVSSSGGIASKITSDIGYEAFPKFSPDGKFIAFSGEYDGNNDLYIIPSNGGEPKRLTYHPSNDRMIEWFNDGKKILFQSGREPYKHSLFTISVEGGFPEALPLPEGGLTSFSPDGNKIAYCRQNLEFRTWKRYKGGTAPDIWIYDLKNNTIEQITNYEGIDFFPMWYEDKIYFASDREHTMNIFCYDTKTKTTRKITNHNEYDVNWPSLGTGFIVYENGGYIYTLDLKTEKSQKISIEVPSDRIFSRAEYKNVSKYIRSYSLSPTGARALVDARGDIFTIPAKKGDFRNITQTPAIREMNPVWSPDGKWIAYLSDKTGEYEIYIRSQDGSGEEIRITTDGDCYRFNLVWSPDSKKILFSDKKLRLFYVDINEKKPILIDKSDYYEIQDYSWSKDSKWVAYSKPNDNYYTSIFIYSVDAKKSFRITDGLNNDFNPVFDPDGKYLFFISGTLFNSLFGDFEESFLYKNNTKIRVVTLQADSLSPFPSENDEEKMEKKKKKDDDEKNDNKDKSDDKSKPKEVKIDFDNIGQRIVAVPIKEGNYHSLKVFKDKLFYISYTLSLDDKPNNDLHIYDIKDRKDKIFISGIDGYDISDDGEKIIYKSGNIYGIVDSKSNANVGDGSINASAISTIVDPKAEYQQIFNEAWRLERDFFYDPQMHGVDWAKMKEKYGVLVPYVSHRNDLNYVIGEMIGELSCSHTYIWGGDMPNVDYVGVGLLGCDFEIDTKSGFYKIKKIYKGENWNEKSRSPLTEPGVNIKEGDYLIAVNNNVIRYPSNIFSFFQGTANKIVDIKVNSRPSIDGARSVNVKTIPNEFYLRYLDWVETNRQKVNIATNNRVAYIHLPNTSLWGIDEFSKYFFPQINKEALIIDVRFNGGGMIPDIFVEKLRRELLNVWVRREGKNTPTPTYSIHGPKVCIINEYAGSGGDAFPYYFRQYNIGKLIGKRTWGGLVGISRNLPFVDNGAVTCPEFGILSLDGEWIIENYGVAPDIEVDNRPDLVVKGQDPQLEKAIEIIMKELEKNPVKFPKTPKFPIKK